MNGRSKASGGQAWSSTADLALVEGERVYRRNHSIRSGVQMEASRAPQLQDNIDWEMMSVEEALDSLERMTELPSVRNFICILQKCRKTKSTAYARRVHMHICNNGLEAHRAIGNHLVPMFVECGSMSDAQRVFNGSVHPNEYSWTSLIQGYIECGEWQHALNLFQKMQENVVHPSRYTFVALLRACAELKCTKRGRDIHTQIAKVGYKSDLFVGSTLVDMYFKCGALAEAQEVFDKLPVRDLVSWNRLIAGYAEHGLGEEALNRFEQMQLEEDVSPSAATFVCSLKACVTIGAIQMGQELHAQIAKEGHEGNVFVGSTLVDMYVKSGLLAEAREVFDRLLDRNVVSWTTLIRGYAEHGLGEEAWNCLEQMQLEGIPPDAAVLVSSLKACGSVGAIHRVREVYTKITKQGFERDSFVGSAVVDTYAKCGSLAEALEVFDKLPVRDVVLWNVLIAGYVEFGLCEEALNCLEQMQLEDISPTTVTFVCSLKACGSIGAPDRCQDIHAEIATQGYEGDPFVGNALVDMYAKCGSLAEALEVFLKLPAQDVVSWNALIAGYAEHDLGEEALNCLEQMQIEGVSPNAVTFVCSLKSCSSIADICRGRAIHAEIIKHRFEGDPFVSNTLLNMYAKCGWLAEAQDVFDKLPVRNVVTWNALIAGYTEHGFVGEQALNCLEQMQLEGVSPDVISWNAIIYGYTEQGENEKAVKLYAQMQEQGLLPTSVTFLSTLKACADTAALETGKKIHAQIYRAEEPEAIEETLATAIIDMYGKCGSMVDALQVFDVMPTRRLVTWNALIAGYTRQGENELVFHLFERMRKAGIQPDKITFLSVLTVCSHSGLVSNGQKYFEDMSKKYAITPTINHHNCMVDLLARAGKLDEAMSMLEKMPFQPDFVTWSTVLRACQSWGMVELGRQAFECAIRSDKKHGAAFILMSNIYADNHI